MKISQYANQIGTPDVKVGRNKGVAREHKKDKQEEAAIRDNTFRIELENAGIPYDNKHARKEFGTRRFLARITRERSGADQAEQELRAIFGVFGPTNEYGNPTTD